MEEARIKKYKRRARNAKWARECLLRATQEDGSMHRARRAAHLSQALSVWLDKNAPLSVEAYSEG
jgi:hypothetical protein